MLSAAGDYIMGTEVIAGFRMPFSAIGNGFQKRPIHVNNEAQSF